MVFQVKEGLRYSTASKNYKKTQIGRKHFSYIDAYKAFDEQRHDLGRAAEEHLQ